MHWTYEESLDPLSDLRQGDILEPTQDLKDVFSLVHPHFRNPKYSAFLIITQSCDLVRRKGKILPDIQHISVSVVRPLESVLHDLLSQVCDRIVDKVYLKESKLYAHQLLQRIFNQNEQALGIFYLHPDPAVRISIPSVALLRIKITLRTEHYNVLISARRGRLQPSFRNKLGWLLGNLYSRIGTPDWSESESKQKELNRMIKDYIDDDEDDAPLWVPKMWLDSAMENGINIEGIPKSQIIEVLNKHKPPELREQAISHILRVIRESGIIEDDEALTRIGNRLRNDGPFTRVLKSAKKL